MRAPRFREPECTPEPRVSRHVCERPCPQSGRHKGGHHMVPLLLWILGVPGLIIILLLLLGVIHL